MDNQYFDDKLRGLLENAPEVQPDCETIKDFRRALRATKDSKQRRLWPILFLPLLLGMFWLAWRNSLLLDQFQQLAKRVEEGTKVDTIYQIEHIYRGDTIVQFVFLHAAFQNSNTFPAFANALPTFDKPITGIQMGGSTGLSSHLFKYTSTNRHAEPDGIPLTPIQTPFPKLPGFPVAPILYQRNLNNLGWITQQPTLPLSKGEKRLLSFFRPTALHLGLQVTPLQLGPPPLDGDFFSAGLQFHLAFPGKRSLGIYPQIVATSVKVETPEVFNEFPVVLPNDPSDELHEIKGQFQYLEMPLLLQQDFRLKGRLHPRISIGLVAAQSLRRSLNYEFYADDEEYSINGPISDPNFTLQHARLGTGLIYYFGKQFSLNTDLFYQFKFPGTPSQILDLQYLGWSIGIRYNLKK